MASEIDWSEGWLAERPRAALAARGARVCRAGLDVEPAEAGALAALLSPDERARADRFHFERDRRRFVVARGVLRRVLGEALGVPPVALRFAAGPHGKPWLLDGALRFNVAHSDGLALIGLHETREIGVDLERARPLPDMAQLAALTFAPAERSVWEGLPREAQSDAFFRAWARTEALAKARGTGFGAPARDPGPDEWVTDFEAAPGFAAAVALCYG